MLLEGELPVVPPDSVLGVRGNGVSALPSAVLVEPFGGPVSDVVRCTVLPQAASSAEARRAVAARGRVRVTSARFALGGRSPAGVSDPIGVVRRRLGVRRPQDLLSAALMHATARVSVRYGDGLDFAGRDIDPSRTRVKTRHGKVPVLVYGQDGLPVYVHLHGGAWMMRYPKMDDWWCRYLAAEAGVQVLNVDFRTGPYVTYPVSQEQAFDVAVAKSADVIGGFSCGWRHGRCRGADGSRHGSARAQAAGAGCACPRHGHGEAAVPRDDLRRASRPGASRVLPRRVEEDGAVRLRPSWRRT